MIRRDPTLIPMGDLEVQDIRDRVAKQKEEYENHKKLMKKIKDCTENPDLLKDDPEMLEHFTMVANAKREEKARRLGLDKA